MATTAFARALMAAAAADGAELSGPWVNAYAPLVRAVLEAIREPDEAMYRADSEILYAAKYNHGIGWQWTAYPDAHKLGYMPGRIWRTMMDAVLAEEDAEEGAADAEPSITGAARPKAPASMFRKRP